jgi:hypothetical protein
MAEPGSDLVRTARHSADGWYIGRIGYVETLRAGGASRWTQRYADYA